MVICVVSILICIAAVAQYFEIVLLTHALLEAFAKQLFGMLWECTQYEFGVEIGGECEPVGEVVARVGVDIF